MLVQCPNCGQIIEVGGLGRKPLNIPLNNVYDALKTYRSIEMVAQKLRCSQGYIYNILKANGLNLDDIIKGN